MAWMPQSLLNRIAGWSQRLQSSTVLAQGRRRERVGNVHTATSASVSAAEWGFVAAVTLAILVLTSLPYLFAVFSAPADKQFMGFIINVDDHTQYLAWYKAFQTEHLIANRLTSEPNPPLFFNLLWWTLGRLGYYSGLSYEIVYQIFRWLSGAFFLAMVYATAALFFSSVAQRRMAFLVVALGAGLGWILVVLKYTVTGGVLPLPMNLYIAEGNTFLCILGYPHFAEAAGFILAVFWLLLVGEERQQLRYAVGAGVVALLLGWQHTYDLIIVWGVPMAYAAVRWLIERRWPDYWFKAMLIVGVISVAPAIYSVWLTSANPLWEEVLAQFSNAGVFTPRPLHMLILMGIPLIVAIITFGLILVDIGRRGVTSRFLQRGPTFLGVWFVVGWGLTYIPTDYQVHMISSWQVPVGFVATIGLFAYAIPWMQRRWPSQRVMPIVALGFLLLIIPTNLYLLSWRFVDLQRYNPPYFLERDEVAAMHWLETAPSESVVFSAYDVGRYLPGISGQRVFLGHWAQTVDFFNKRDIVTEFFAASTTEQRRQQIIAQYDIDYVFYGQEEQSLGGYAPDTSDWLTPVFTTPHAMVYAVDE